MPASKPPVEGDRPSRRSLIGGVGGCANICNIGPGLQHLAQETWRCCASADQAAARQKKMQLAGPAAHGVQPLSACEAIAP